MSFIRLGLQAIGNSTRAGLQRVISARSFSQSFALRSSEQQLEADADAEENSTESDSKPEIPPAADRSKVIPVEVSIKYLQSDAYKTTYGKDPVWKMYRRNFKGQFLPRKTRRTCVRNNAIATSNPCPICRDEYLVLDHRNIELINQFISPFNGEILSTRKTGLCQHKHNQLLVAILRAKNFGTISFDVPYRKYDYTEWYKPELVPKEYQ